MGDTSIPDWLPTGVLPPIHDADPTGFHRSPYQVSLLDFVLRFSTSAARRKILAGFLAFRSELHDLGLVRGFHWINGSFLEQIEIVEGRAPNDMDVVTFVDPPIGLEINDRLESLLDHAAVKNQYLVDHYFVELNLPGPLLVEQAAYWFGLWSHRRTWSWKGFVQIGLQPDNESAALKNLALILDEEAST